MHVQQCSLFLFLILFQASACSGSSIVGGREVKKPKPWMVSIQVENSRVENYQFENYHVKYNHICGGTLIQQQWVLTAANCKRSKPMTVLVGAHSLTKDKNAERVKVQRLYIPDTFRIDTKVNDIMLLKLQNKVQFKRNKVEAKKIPKSGKDVPAGTKCEVRGWGSTHVENTKIPSDTLQEVEVTVVDRELCNCYYNRSPIITEDMLCAGNKQEGKDVCWWDSGGPLECKKSFVGVVSGEYGCGRPKKPGVYTLLSKKHIAWINKILKQSNSTEV